MRKSAIGMVSSKCFIATRISSTSTPGKHSLNASFLLHSMNWLNMQIPPPSSQNSLNRKKRNKSMLSTRNRRRKMMNIQMKNKMMKEMILTRKKRKIKLISKLPRTKSISKTKASSRTQSHHSLFRLSTWNRVCLSSSNPFQGQKPSHSPISINLFLAPSVTHRFSRTQSNQRKIHSLVSFNLTVTKTRNHPLQNNYRTWTLMTNGSRMIVSQSSRVCHLSRNR